MALNIHSPNGTGDWHSAATFAKPIPDYLFLCGDNQPNNTNHLLGDTSVIDGTQRLNRMDIYPRHTPGFIADHPRACFNLYSCFTRRGNKLGMIDYPKSNIK